jgi:hypothetical protein
VDGFSRVVIYAYQHHVGSGCSGKGDGVKAAQVEFRLGFGSP